MAARAVRTEQPDQRSKQRVDLLERATHGRLVATAPPLVPAAAGKAPAGDEVVGGQPGRCDRALREQGHLPRHVRVTQRGDVRAIEVHRAAGRVAAAAPCSAGVSTSRNRSARLAVRAPLGISKSTPWMTRPSPYPRLRSVSFTRGSLHCQRGDAP